MGFRRFLIFPIFCTIHFLFAQEVPEDTFNIELNQFPAPSVSNYEEPDSVVASLRANHEKFLQEGDTLKSIAALLELTNVYGHKAEYANSYDAFWKSLTLADKLDNDSLNVDISMGLGRFYSFYKREHESIKYLQNSLRLQKKRVNEGILDETFLVENYHAFLSTYRELDKPIMAQKYLDSCLIYYKRVANQVPWEYLEFERAFILSKKGQSGESIQIMEEIEPWFLRYQPSYLVLLYTYWGDFYQNLSQLSQSESFYRRALSTSEQFQGHIDFTPLIYERLAKLYVRINDYRQAFENLEKAKQLDTQFFDSRSTNNRGLLEIRDEFRLEKERQEQLIQKQRLEQLEQEEQISFLQRALLLGTIVFILILVFVYVKNLRNKHRIEKELLRRNKELEIQKANELLELKNKELAASALQLVEKEEFLKELKTKLRSSKDELKVSEMNKILRSISISNNNNWEEFRLRFTAVNEEFYKKLTEKYPKLSQSDHKICALVKLNFSSKDMSRLLGISVESVHTTRYRLRKKLGLDRSANLEEFIANL